MLKRTRLRRISAKRVRENAEYMKVRAEYLKDHPYCEWWLMERGLTQEDIDPLGGIEWNQGFNMVYLKAPMSQEIHHRRGRGKFLCDRSTFMAVSHLGHLQIHATPAISYERGYMLPRR